MAPKAAASQLLPSLVKKLVASGTSFNAKLAADNLARATAKSGLAALGDQNVLKLLHNLAENGKPNERTASAVAFGSLSTVLGPAVFPVLLQSLPILLALCGDDDDTVRSAGTRATQAFSNICPVEGLPILLEALISELAASGKWRTKVACLKEIARLVDVKEDESREEVANILAKLLPSVEHTMHDTKKEVRVQSLTKAIS